MTLDDLDNRDSFQTTGHMGAHWRFLNRSLNDGKDTLGELQTILEALDKDVSFLDGTRRYLRLRESTERIVEYRQHVQSYRDAIQFSLQTITLYEPHLNLRLAILIHRSWNTTLTREDTATLGPKVDEVDRKLYELSTNLEVKLHALTLLASTTGRENRVDSLQRLKDTVQSAATVLSAASTVVDNYDNRNSDILSVLDVAPWEPNDQFHQWMASVVDFSGSAQDAMALNIPHRADTIETLARAPPSRLPPDPPGSHVEVQPNSPVPGKSPRRRPPIPTGYRLEPTFSEPSTPSPPDPPRHHVESPTSFQDADGEQCQRMPSGQNGQNTGHSRSSSAPTIRLTPTLTTTSPSARSRFWGRSSPKLQQANVNAGLVVHEPGLNSALSVPQLLSESNDRFQLTQLLARSKRYMNFSNIPLPSTRNGKTFLKAVYVGDGACGKTSAIMYITLIDHSLTA